MSPPLLAIQMLGAVLRIMIYYLILDKTNKIVCDFTDKKKAENYVAARPYLKIQEFEPPIISRDVVEHTSTDEPDGLPF